MPPKRNESPTEVVVAVLLPATILLVIIAIFAWGINQVNVAIPVVFAGWGSGLIIGALAVMVAIYYKYQ